MNFLPYRKITYATYLEKPKAIECFRKAVFTHYPSPFYFPGSMDYVANIHDDYFTAKRLHELLPGYRTTHKKIIPVLKGQFIPSPTGTIVLVEMHPQFFGILINGCLIFASFYFILRDLDAWLNSGYLPIDGVFLLFISVLAYMLMVSNFDPEVERVKTFLNDVYGNKERA